MALLCSLHQPELAAHYFDRVIDLAGAEVLAMNESGTAGRSVAVAS
jgi:ABC-type phosphate/phosphonate transport system ATPase subunit